MKRNPDAAVSVADPAVRGRPTQPGGYPGERPADVPNPSQPDRGHPIGDGSGSGSLRAPPPRRSRFGWVWILAVLAIIGALVWFVTPHGAQNGPGGKAGRGGPGGRFGAMATTVGVAQARRGDMPIYLNELGTVTPLATVTVRSQISGYLQEIAFKEGQMVQKGQFLAQVDARAYQAQLLQAQGSLARDEASLAEARLDLQRYQTLLAQDSIARQQVDLQATTVKQDEGTVATDQASIATAKLNIAYAHITAPVSGRVGLRQVDVGNYVSTGDANGVVVVTQLAPIDVQFTLPEDNLPQVAARIRAGATLPVTAFDRTAITQLATGQLLTLDNEIDPTTGTLKAKARFDNGAGTLFPQQFVNVRILVDSLHDTVIAPTAAVLRGAQGLFVYVVQGGRNHHTVTVRQVTTGAAAGETTAVVSGLEPGETVVTDGSDRLREGAQVILPGDCIPSPSGPGGRRGGFGQGGAGPGGFGQGGAGQNGGGGGGRAMGQRSFGGPGGSCGPGQRPAGGPGGGPSAGAGQGGQAQTGSTGGHVRGPDAGRAAGASMSSGAADDQAGGQGGGQGGAQGGQMQAVLAKLNLDPQQQLKAQAIFAKARGDAMAAAGSAGDDPDARRTAMRQARGQALAQLEPLLRPDQKAKLAQLRAQMAAGGGGGRGAGGGPLDAGGGQP